MAFGGGGSANYQANFILNTSQAQGALQRLDKDIQRALGNVQKAATKAVSGQITQMDRVIQNMAGQTGNTGKGFKVLDANGKQVTRTIYSMTKSQKAGLLTMDKWRAGLIKQRDALADLKKSGQITTGSLNGIADGIDKIAARAGAARGGQLKKLSDSIRQMGVDLEQANAIANPPVQAAKRPSLTSRFLNRFKRQAPQAPQAVGSGAGGRGGGRRPPAKRDDLVRGQMMPMRSKQAAEGLLKLSSAAQGAMLGISALDQNVVGLAFGLVFLSYGLVGVATAAAAMTIALVGAKRMLMAITASALEAGKAFEASGQQIANFFRSGDYAMKFKAENIEIAKTFAVPIKQVDELRFALEQVGLRGPAYIKAALNAQGAGVGDAKEIAQRFAEIAKARPEQRGNMVQRFAQDMNIPVKEYTNSLELAEAINKRFAGSAEAMAQTTQGAIQRMKNTWQEFAINLGVLLNEYVKPVFELATSFLQGMVNGFKDAFKTDQETGKLKRTVDGLQVSMRKLAPYLMAVGAILGRVLYKAAILAAQGLKVLFDVIRSSLKWAKEYKDEFGAAGTSFKKNFLDVVISAPTILAATIAALKGFGGAFIQTVKPKITIEPDFKLAGEEGGEGIFARLFKGIKSIPSDIFKGLFKGLKAGLLFALFESLALTAVDLLPISESWKDSLQGVVRMTFLGGALGSMFGPAGIVVGGALGAAIGAGLEVVAPGLSGRVMDWIDQTIISALKTVGSFATNTVIPALQEAGKAINDWVDTEAVPALKEFDSWVDTKVTPHIKEWAKEVETNLKPKLNDLSKWLSGDGTNSASGFASNLASTAMSKTSEFARYLNEKFGPAVRDVARILREDIGPAIISVGGWIMENIVPPVKTLTEAFIKFHLWIAENVTPVVLALVNLGLTVLVQYINMAITAFDTFWPVIKTAFEWMDKIYEKIKDVSSWLWDKFGPGIKDSKDKVVDLIELGLDKLTSAIDGLSKIVADPFGTMGTAIDGATGWLIRLWDWVGALVDKIKEISWPSPPGWVQRLWETGGNIFGLVPGGIPFIGNAAGGIVGQKRPLTAPITPGELILNVAQQRAVANQLGGGGGTNIYISVSDSVITNTQAMDEFAGKVATRIASRIGSAKSLTFHRISS